MYYLCKRNEYGDNSIVANKEGIPELMELAIKSVTKDNMENALSMGEKIKDFKSVLPIVYNTEGEKIDNMVYAGVGNLGRQTFLYTDPDSGKIETVDNESMKDVSVKFFLGIDNKVDYFLEDFVKRSKNKEKQSVDSFKNIQLEKKSFYFIKKV